jgi:uncharacterized Zn finger protein (UPF0148 family)
MTTRNTTPVEFSDELMNLAIASLQAEGAGEMAEVARLNGQIFPLVGMETRKFLALFNQADKKMKVVQQLPKAVLTIAAYAIHCPACNAALFGSDGDGLFTEIGYDKLVEAGPVTCPNCNKGFKLPLSPFKPENQPKKRGRKPGSRVTSNAAIPAAAEQTSFDSPAPTPEAENSKPRNKKAA